MFELRPPGLISRLGPAEVSLPHRLPLELIYNILVSYVESAVGSDRAAATRVALVSRAVYDLVSPVLYHTLVITCRNIDNVDQGAAMARLW